MPRTFQPYTAVAGVLPVCNHSTSSGGTCTLSLYTASAGDQSLSQLCATADGNCDWYDLDTARCNLILSACHTSTHRHHSDRAGLSWVHLIRGLYSPDCTLSRAVCHWNSWRLCLSNTVIVRVIAVSNVELGQETRTEKPGVRTYLVVVRESESVEPVQGQAIH